MKQWRHSYFSDYFIYDLEADKANVQNFSMKIYLFFAAFRIIFCSFWNFWQEIVGARIGDFPQAQYADWSPTGHTLLWVSNDKDIYFQTESDGFKSDPVRPGPTKCFGIFSAVAL